jgi:hypothetical protein
MPEASYKSLSEFVSASRTRTRFGAEEKRRVFRGMVVGELEAGFLRYSRRQALIAYASHLGISEFDANLLIAEAQYHAGDIEPLSFENTATLRSVSHPEAWSLSLRLASALTIAILLDLALISWLFH